ncbi:MAG: GHKL domain-containing protein [Eubacteriales bacterium]|nr:GHKL domain-containing protein [Eubacteriales bacterium]
MFWAILNLLLSIIEMIVLWGSVFCFMRVNNRTVYAAKPLYIISFILSAAADYAISLLFQGSWNGVIFQLIVTLLSGLLLFHRNMLAIILDILFSVVLVLGMEFGIFVFNIILAHVDIQIFPNPACTGCIAMSLKIILMLLLATAMIQWKKVHSGGQLSLRQTITVLILPAFSVFFLYSVIQMMTVYTQLYGLWLVLANIIALLLLNIYFLYLFRYLFRAAKLEQEMQMAQLQSELQYRYYEELEKKYRESRKILHDMKNHLQAVEQLYEGENKTAGDNYVQDLYHMIHVLGEKYYSSNQMLNIILNEKLLQASQSGIQVKAEVGDVNFDDIKDIDITTIFANLLDNAIEAAGAQSWLELKIDNIQDFRVIKIRNGIHLSSDASSSKSNHMGLGLTNVRLALDKYHGSLESSSSEKEYCINIMIPGKEA